MSALTKAKWLVTVVGTEFKVFKIVSGRTVWFKTANPLRTQAVAESIATMLNVDPPARKATRH